MQLLAANSDSPKLSPKSRRMRVQSENDLSSPEVYESPRKVRFVSELMESSEQHYGHSENQKDTLRVVAKEFELDAECMKFCVDQVSSSASQEKSDSLNADGHAFLGPSSMKKERKFHCTEIKCDEEALFGAVQEEIKRLITLQLGSRAKR